MHCLATAEFAGEEFVVMTAMAGLARGVRHAARVHGGTCVWGNE